MKTIRMLLKKYRDVVAYVFFGACTTAVNQGAYALFYSVFGAGNLVSVAAAWLLSVLFAYVTNKLWVFESRSFDVKTLRREAPAFFGARAATGLIDLGIMYVAVDIMSMNGNVWKLVSNVIVIILNYFASKLLVFRKSR